MVHGLWSRLILRKVHPNQFRWRWILKNARQMLLVQANYEVTHIGVAHAQIIKGIAVHGGQLIEPQPCCPEVL